VKYSIHEEDRMPDTHEPRRPHTPPMAEPFMEIDLAAELARLRGESAWSAGHNARTLIKHPDLRVVLIAIDAHARLAEHKAGGRISIQVLEGHVRLKALGRTFSLRAGALLALDRDVAHDVEALENSAILLTVAWAGHTPATS
jgi:quercetin dioxygenase-like cupin family protein